MSAAHVPAKVSKPLWFAFSLLSAMVALQLYVALEWLFFMTKPSMFSGVTLSEALAALIISPAPVVVVIALMQLILSLIGLLLPTKLKGFPLLPGAVILGFMFLILIDNFTYVVIGTGIVNAGTIMRLAYVVILVAAIFYGGYLLAWAAALLMSQPVHWRWILFGVAAIWGLLPVIGVFSERNLADAAVVMPAEPVREPVPIPAADSIRERSAPGLPNILILSADGVPAERVSVYGYSRETTPFLESLQSDWLIAENAFANAGRTHGSLNSILTGKLPIRTRVIFPPQIFRGSDAVEHLPGLLKTLGYRTAQLGMRHYADARDAGLIGAFDLANYRWEKPGSDAPYARVRDKKVELVRSDIVLFREAMSDRLTSRLLHIFGLRLMIDAYGHVTQKRESPYWSDRRRVKTAVEIIESLPTPWFFQIHLLDTHCCNRNPRASFRSYFSSGDDDARFDAEIRDSDSDFQEIVRAIRRSGQMENTIIVITSDHTPRWTTDGRLPLMIRFPHGEHSGVISEDVQLVDIAPTILDYLKQPIPSWMDGISLISGDLDPSRPIFGTGKMGGQKTAGAELGELADLGPPTYGVVSVTLTIGDQFFELDLSSGELEERRIENHTKPLEWSLSEADARKMLTGMLLKGGFGVPKQ